MRGKVSNDGLQHTITGKIPKYYYINIPNGHKTYQMATKHTKWPQNIPNGHKTYQMAVK
jgi:hypothetical protein